MRAKVSATALKNTISKVTSPAVNAASNGLLTWPPSFSSSGRLLAKKGANTAASTNSAIHARPMRAPSLPATSRSICAPKLRRRRGGAVPATSFSTGAPASLITHPRIGDGVAEIGDVVTGKGQQAADLSQCLHPFAAARLHRLPRPPAHPAAPEHTLVDDGTAPQP